jgi:multidrug efflux system outer membrane protein
MRPVPAVALALALLTGCAVGPNYRRPDLPVPPQFRDAEQPGGTNSLADMKWFELFHDDVLKGLVKEALEGNHDLKIASARVLEAREQYGITRADLFPQLNVGAQFSALRNSQIGQFRFLPAGISLDTAYTQAGFSLGWELDLWGRIRRLKESARAQYLASEQVRHGVVTTLVADVSTFYLDLRELDLELEIARKTRDTAENGLRLTTLRHNRGVATGLDVHQAEQLLYTATAQIASAERAIRQNENALSLLLGRNPGDIARGKGLEELAPPAGVPAGLPSALLERRPDVRQAEDMLIAANAQIGAAKAQYFPQISLTGFLGGQSRALSDLFVGPARQWSFVPSATAPIFTAGKIRSGVRFTEAQRMEALAIYQKTVQTAFREVSDALIGYTKNSQQRTEEERLVRALRETARLSRLRYQGGLDSYLQVLDADRNLFQAELVLAQLRREELVAVVQLYRALGGGWQ